MANHHISTQKYLVFPSVPSFSTTLAHTVHMHHTFRKAPYMPVLFFFCRTQLVLIGVVYLQANYLLHDISTSHYLLSTRLYSHCMSLFCFSPFWNRRSTAEHCRQRCRYMNDTTLIHIIKFYLPFLSTIVILCSVSYTHSDLALLNN